MWIRERACGQWFPVVALALAVALGACSHLGHGKGAAAGSEAVPEAGDDVEAALRSAVSGMVRSAPAAENPEYGELRRHKPYFFREYSVYPDGADTARVLIRDTESRTAPKTGSVRLPKVRYTTELRRKRDEARRDSHYFRQTGTETLSYEWRDGQWHYLGSLFVVDATEENINGEWVPSEREVMQALKAEEAEGGWLKRSWQRVKDRF